MRTVVLTLPMPLNLANARLHWLRKNRKRDEWMTRAIVAEKQLRGRHRPMQRARVSVVMYIGKHGGGMMDDDNCTARLKWPFDLLKARGLIVDDKRPYLTLEGIPEQRHGTPRRMVLTLTEV